ncbi:hypothetical protein FGO68_gene14383 [Halteria grandinella]|uniref:Uncharacterized protein n=1 Tax=Halteria grandinella TaxID=5974 RepID=A0A8J8T126_HALGN|nr:hypothetical protein FGO68_gene14383 [Halteria grandinella]
MFSKVVGTLSFTTIPQIFEISIASNLTLPIEQIKKVPVLNILLNESYLNLKFQGPGKLGSNVQLSFADIATVAENSRMIQSMNLLVDQYDEHIDFETCNYYINCNRIQLASIVFAKLQNEYSMTNYTYI